VSHSRLILTRSSHQTASPDRRSDLSSYTACDVQQSLPFTSLITGIFLLTYGLVKAHATAQYEAAASLSLTALPTATRIWYHTARSARRLRCRMGLRRRRERSDWISGSGCANIRALILRPNRLSGRLHLPALWRIHRSERCTPRIHERWKARRASSPAPESLHKVTSILNPQLFSGFGRNETQVLIALVTSSHMPDPAPLDTYDLMNAHSNLPQTND
jgi:hypothetical protein